jgi:chromosome segregation ATPase
LEAERKEREQTHLNEINQHKDALRDLTDRNNVDATKWRSFEEAFKTEIDRLKRLSRDQESQRKSLSVELNLLKMEVEKVTKQKDSFSQKLAAAVVTQNDSRAELSELEVRCAKLKAENIQLQHNSIKIQSTLTDNYDRSQSQIENMQASIKALKLQKQQAESEVTSLTGENNALREHQTSAKIQISHLEATVKNLTNRQQRATDEIKSLKETLKKSQEDHFFHRDDAQQLRAYISQAGKQQSPIRDEMIYIRGFRELKTDVESWIARNAKASAAQIFSINQEAHILGTLADSGIHGQKASVYLRTDNRVQRWYRNPSYRIQLVRHIVAAFLFGHVFQPFIVGLPATSPELLSWIIDNDIKSRGARLTVLAEF